MNLPESFATYLQSGHLPENDGAPTLLAVSGGMDSVVMAHLFRRAGLPFGIAHCNFCLRGAESDADAAFVAALAADWQAPFFTTTFETEQYAAEHGLSIQMAARDLRYAWFHRIATENGFGRIATAHHLDDSVETALLNFVRGTGLNGLRGIPTRSPLKHEENAGQPALIRPLLFAERADLEAWARSQGIRWRDDSSNAADEYARNFIRHRVVPPLRELNPNFVQTAGRNLARLRDTSDNLDFLLRSYFGNNASDASQTIDISQLRALPSPAEALRALLKPQRFTADQIRQIAAGLDHTGLNLESPTGWRLFIDRGKIVLEAPAAAAGMATLQIQADDLMLRLPDGRRLMLMPTDASPLFPDGTDAIVVDAEKLHYPLLLRPWQPGDAFQPFGMKGQSQKLQDFFTNRKVPLFEKDRIPVLLDGDGAIIWVIGHRLDERFRVSSDTTKCLKITCL